MYICAMAVWAADQQLARSLLGHDRVRCACLKYKDCFSVVSAAAGLVATVYPYVQVLQVLQ